MVLIVHKLTEDAQVPSRGSTGAAGYDLYSTESHVILPGKRAVVGTGIAVQLPDGVYGRVAPRSGLSVKHGIHIGAGVVDPDYRGEIKVVMFNLGSESYVIKPGYRIAQLILERFLMEQVVVGDITDTERGEGGFGSTGQ